MSDIIKSKYYKEHSKSKKYVQGGSDMTGTICV
jgi:hypothetical protein